MHHTSLGPTTDKTTMVAGTIQGGEVMKCRAVGEEETGVDGVEGGIAVMAIDHIKDQVILAASMSEM